MKAAIFSDPGKIAMQGDIPMPKAGPGEVIIKVEACGICGSDLAMYRTNAHRAGLNRVVNGLEIPGHEFAGTIMAVGDGVTDFQVGQKAVGVGMGGMAQYVPVPVNPYQLVAMPDGVSFVEAATTEPLADALQMVRLAEVQAGENVVVFGVGIIGLGVIQALKARTAPAGRTIAIDVSDSRLAMAKEVGATHTINPAREDVLKTVAAICGTQTAHMLVPPTDFPDVAVVIDCAGYIKHMKGDPPLQLALDMLRPAGGRIVCFGAYEGKFPIDFMPVINKQPTIRGSMGYAAEELAEALQLMASGKVDRRKLISNEFPLEQVQQAFETQANGVAIKVMLKPNAD